MKRNKKLLLFTLCTYLGFVLASCSDDTIEPQKVDVEQDSEADDLEYSNEELIEYVMSQFAELNDDGSLYKRTTFFRQLDESDSTAIYTRTATLADARRKFLSLVPESYQKKVIVKNDSAEMSIPMGTSPLMLKYKEGSTDANVLATVQLPSQGAYTKIANTLTMVQSFGANDFYDANQYLCRFKQIEHKVLAYYEPLPLDSVYRPLREKLKIETHTLNMLCYHVTEDGKAQYVFIPPLVKGERQLRFRNTYNYLVGHLYPYWFKTSFIEGNKEYNLVELQKLLGDVLPSPKQVKGFVTAFENFGYDTRDERGVGLDYTRLRVNYSDWYDDKLYSELKAMPGLKDDSLATQSYLYQMESLLKGCGNTAVLNLFDISQHYPYVVGMYANYSNYPQIPKYVVDSVSIKLKRPFFINGDDWVHGKQDDTEGQDKAMQRICSIATNSIYIRDKNDVARVISQFDGWEVLDYYTEDKKAALFSYFFKPVLNPLGYQEFKPQGRWIEGTNCFPFHILYLAEEEMEPMPDEE